MVRVVRLERTVSWSQTRRDTNFAIPGYSIFTIIPRRGRKSKIFLSVVIYVVKADFIPLSAIVESPANTGVTRLCGVSPCPAPDTDAALPNQAPYQLGHTRKLRCIIHEAWEKSKSQYGHPSCRRETASPQPGGWGLGWRLGGNLDDPLGLHGFGDLQETGDVGTGYIVAFHAVLLGGGIQVAEDVDHDGF